MKQKKERKKPIKLRNGEKLVEISLVLSQVMRALHFVISWMLAPWLANQPTVGGDQVWNPLLAFFFFAY